VIGDQFTIRKGASQSAPPAVPANFAASTNGSSAILTWANNATNEAGYHLQCSVNGGAFVEIAAIGANLTSYTHTGLGFTNAYSYRLHAWNNAGASDDAVANLTPSGALVIAQQPQDVTCVIGGTADFSVLAYGGTTINYQWYRDTTPLPGETNRTLQRLNVQPSDAGYYMAVIYDASLPHLSDAALLTVVSEVMAPRMVWPPEVVNNWFFLGFQGTPGVTYTLQSAGSLAGLWQNRTNVTVPPNGILLIEDTTLGTPRQFYRLVFPPQR
jgi:hypothetical protein